MTLECARGCLLCGEDRRLIKALVKRAAREERAGRSLSDLREQVAEVKARLANCSAAGHTTSQALRYGLAAPAEVTNV